MSVRIHYAGALTWKIKGVLHRALAGWPVCCSGSVAAGLAKKGRITYTKAKVTCTHCRVRVAWADISMAVEEAKSPSPPIPQLTLMEVKVPPETQARALAHVLRERLNQEAVVDLLLLLQRHPEVARGLLERELATYLKELFPQYFAPTGGAT